MDANQRPRGSRRTHECHEVYERALIDNDAAALDALFWDSPHALRFGVTENLHGAEEIRAFRQGRPKINLDREIRRLDIMAFGDSAGIVNLEFMRPDERYREPRPPDSVLVSFRGGLEDRVGSCVFCFPARPKPHT